MSLFICIALAFSSLLILWLSSTYLQRSYFLQYTSTRNGCAPPRSLPSKDLFFGLDTFFAAMKAMNNHCRMRTIQAQTRIYGRTFQSFPFNRRVITITSARNIQHVLSHEHEKFGVSPIRGPSVAMTGPGIITNDGKVWEHARAMIRPSFARSLVADRDMFDVHVEHFLGLLPELGATVDLQPLFDRLILDSSSEFIFGEGFGSLLPSSPVDSAAFINAFNIAQKGVGIRILFGKLKFVLARDSKFQHACKLIKDYTQRHIEQTLRQKAKRGKMREQKKIILISELAKVTNDRSELCSQLLNVFFAGRDTPAVALTNIFFLLARHPNIWNKCRAEVESLRKEDLTFERLKSLRYIQHVINEALRLLPPVAAQSRVCTAHSILPNGGGPHGSQPVFVQPGDTIAINFFTLHRDPKLFGPDPETFRPERWAEARPTWEFLPFGGGARHCPAQQLALFWVGYTMVRILLKYESIRSEDSVEEYVENMKLNMESLNGAKVSFVCSSKT